MEKNAKKETAKRVAAVAKAMKTAKNESVTKKPVVKKPVAKKTVTKKTVAKKAVKAAVTKKATTAAAKTKTVNKPVVAKKPVTAKKTAKPVVRTEPVQTEIVDRYIRKNGYITPVQAINELGITRLSGTIFKLKKQGKNIITTKTQVTLQNGHTALFAKYAYTKKGTASPVKEKSKVRIKKK